MEHTVQNIILALQILATPTAIGIIAFIYLKISKKKLNTIVIQQLFIKILATVKELEKDLDLKVSEKIDPRMQKALDLYNQLKNSSAIKLAASYLGFDLSKLKLEDVQDIFEKLIHAKKLSLDFDVVNEIKTKLN
jgi:hypothetical protein